MGSVTRLLAILAVIPSGCLFATALCSASISSKRSSMRTCSSLQPHAICQRWPLEINWVGVLVYLHATLELVYAGRELSIALWRYRKVWRHAPTDGSLFGLDGGGRIQSVLAASAPTSALSEFNGTACSTPSAPSPTSLRFHTTAVMGPVAPITVAPDCCWPKVLKLYAGSVSCRLTHPASINSLGGDPCAAVASSAHRARSRACLLALCRCSSRATVLDSLSWSVVPSAKETAVSLAIRYFLPRIRPPLRVRPCSAGRSRC